MAASSTRPQLNSYVGATEYRIVGATEYRSGPSTLGICRDTLCICYEARREGRSVKPRTPTPPPYPSGWYCVGISNSLRSGQHRAITFMGEELVLYRTKSGQACLADAFCPHLGAHLGDGKVVGDEFRCPFHGLTFNVGGQCAASPYGKPPQAARLHMFEVIEENGLILAGHGDLTWKPRFPLGSWPEVTTRRWRFRGHPQEVTENSVDLAHLSVLHRFADLRVLNEVETVGPALTAAYSIRRRIPLMRNGVYAEFRIRAEGLGYSEVEITLPELGIEVRQWILPTPVRDEVIDLRLALTLRGPLRSIAQRAVVLSVAHEINRDIAIWQRKHYLPRPALSKDDGPIGKYRAWTRQFYQTGANGRCEVTTAERRAHTEVGAVPGRDVVQIGAGDIESVGPV